MRLIYAWDDPLPEATALPSQIERVFQEVDRIKIGAVVFTAMGRSAMNIAGYWGVPVMLDLKFHDIPNTVSKAVKAACDLGVATLTVHTSGGMKMMEAAAKAAEDYDTKVLGITLLTSMRLLDMIAVGLPVNPKAPDDEWTVLLLSQAAKHAGLDGVVCSAQEAAEVRKHWVDGLIVCPAIRPDWSVPADQKRPTTPLQAKEAGADEIVLGRAVSEPPDGMTPIEAIERIREELA